MDLPKPMPISLPLLCILREKMHELIAVSASFVFGEIPKRNKAKKLIIFFQEAAFQHGATTTIFLKRGPTCHYLSKLFYYTKEFISGSSQNKPLLALF